MMSKRATAPMPTLRPRSHSDDESTGGTTATMAETCATESQADTESILLSNEKREWKQARALNDMNALKQDLQMLGFGNFETVACPHIKEDDEEDSSDEDDEDCHKEKIILLEGIPMGKTYSDLSSKQMKRDDKSLFSRKTEDISTKRSSSSDDEFDDDDFLLDEDERSADKETLIYGNVAVPLSIRAKIRDSVEISSTPDANPSSDDDESHDSGGLFDASPEAVAKAIDKAIRSERRNRNTPSTPQESSTELTLEPLESSSELSDENEAQTRRRSLLGGGRKTGNRDNNVIHTTKSDAVHELCVNLRQYPERGLSRPDPELMTKVTDFHRARYQRRQHVRSQPWGVLGLFMYVADLRVDLQWTEDAAWRRANAEPEVKWKQFNKAHSPDYKKAYFVYLMEIITIIMMMVAMAKNNWKFEPIQVNPMLGPSAETLLDLGALNSELVVQDNEWYRLVASLFLHAGIIHLFINLLALHFLGGPVERVHGTALTAVIFLLSGIGGNLLSVLFVQNTVSVGASGGLFGLLGLCLVNSCTNWDLITLRNHRDKNDPAHKGFPYSLVILVLVVELGINIIVGLTPYVDNMAHLGGLLYGVLFGFPLLSFDKTGFSLRKLHSHGRVFLSLRILSFLMAILLLILTLVAAIQYDANEPLCSWCRYATCAPFPFWTEEPWWHCDDCQKTSALWTRYAENTVVTMTCPFGEEVVVDLLNDNIDTSAIGKELPGLCREFCPN